MIIPGLVSITFRQLSPREIVALVRKAGLSGIEWGGDLHAPHGDEARAREVSALTHEHGLTVAAYGSYYRAGVSEGQGLSFASVLATAQILQAPTIRVWAGNKGSREATAADRQAVMEDLGRVAGLAEKAGLTISLEYHGGTLTDGLDSTVDLLRQTDHSALKSYWQPEHGRPVEEGLRQIGVLGSHLTNLHVFHWWPDARNRLPLAQGEQRWREFLQRAASLEGDRFALLEFVGQDSPEQFLQDACTLRGWLESC